MKEMREKLASYELTQMKEAIATQFHKDAKERELKERAAAIEEKELADEMEREMDAQVKRETRRRG